MAQAVYGYQKEGAVYIFPCPAKFPETAALKSSKNLTHQLKNTLNLSEESILETKTHTKLTIQNL